VASSGFHGSCPTKPSTIHAAQSSTSPACLSARYGPEGDNSAAVSVRSDVSESGMGSECRVIERRSPRAPVRLWSYFRVNRGPMRVRLSNGYTILGCTALRATPRNLPHQAKRQPKLPFAKVGGPVPSRRGLGLARVALAELLHTAGGVDDLLLAGV